MLEVEAPTYEEALAKANNLLLNRLNGDGLPLWPATRERVDWILRGATLPRTHVLGKFPPRGGITTIETCAVALAMAGDVPNTCRSRRGCRGMSRRRGLRSAAGDLRWPVPRPLS
jgi:hypothetical protein